MTTRRDRNPVPRKRAVTANDIAMRANVSRTAVSVVLNGARSNVRVSDATRQRIEEIADTLGYSPNRAAQALRRRRSGVIGFVPMVIERSRTPLDLPVQYLLGTYLARTALNQRLHIVEATMTTPACDLTQLLLNLGVDGAIFHSPKSAREVQSVVELGIPVVQLMRPQYEAETFTITVDPEPGITAGVNYLIELGHRRIAFIGANSVHPNDAVRMATFVDALREQGIHSPPEYLKASGEYSIENGCSAAYELMSSEEQPTAILAAGDSLALGVLHALYQLHLRVPEDVSLISYDDAFVRDFYPALTSISQPYELVAEQAISVIAQASSSSSDAKRDLAHAIHPSQLVKRASTGPPNERG